MESARPGDEEETDGDVEMEGDADEQGEGDATAEKVLKNPLKLNLILLNM